ncbi:MAG: family 43 glycosylhydrolase [Erysipelotrichaceae bacterium]|nr:family 43 glycosylhydrolase [Erysipelotrichaceae bacterium]
MADPFIVYDDRENGTNKFYAYGTTGQVQAAGFYAYESTNLTDWENPKVVFRRDPNGGTWCNRDLWAPEVIYDEETNLYYMFYSARWGSVNNYLIDNYGSYYDRYYSFYASVAVCEEPNGTFYEYEGPSKTALEPLIIFEDHADEIPSYLASTCIGKEGKQGFIKVIDASPFVDPVTGKKYLYLIADVDTPYTTNGFVIGMEMEDWTTPKYETLTKLTEFGKTTVGGSTNITEGQRTNEGCSVYYHDGNYYLTFSTYIYSNTNYQVRQAIASSPLGNYTKIQPSDGGVVIKTNDDLISQSAGHSSFLQLGDELYIVYHSFYNDVDVEDGRRPALDKAVFVDNGSGLMVLKTNGPTTTPQLKPEILTGYKNIAEGAVVSVSEGDGSTYLNDGFLPLFDEGFEYISENGKVTITIDLPKASEVRGLMIYNSKNANYRFNSIESIVLSNLNKNYEYGNLIYDSSEYSRNNKDALDAALILNTYKKGITTISITFNENSHIAIPEIVVIGK